MQQLKIENDNRAVQRFRVAVPDSEVTNLRHRLLRTRFVPGSAQGLDWAAGMPVGYLSELVEYWGRGCRVKLIFGSPRDGTGPRL